MKIFISHSHRETKLAQLWKDLLTAIHPKVSVFFSSDPDPTEGMDAGMFRDDLENKIENADALIYLLTPDSIEQPWVIYELGYARALDKVESIYPVLYWLTKSSVPDPVADQLHFNGENTREVARIVGRLFTRQRSLNQRSVDELVGIYANGLSDIQSSRIHPRLFTDLFHDSSLSLQLEGKWYLKWVTSKGPSEIHDAYITNHLNRIRINYTDRKNWETAFEGIVSKRSKIALNWWAGIQRPELTGSPKQACGTALLELAPNNKYAKGVYQGYATLHYPYDKIGRDDGWICFSKERRFAEEFKPDNEPGSTELGTP